MKTLLHHWFDNPEPTPANRLTSETGLHHWRENLLRQLVLFALVIGSLAVIPSVWLGWRAGLPALAVFDALAYLSLFWILRGRAPYAWRATYLAGLVYLVGLVVLLATGPYGAGLFWMFGFPPLAAVLLGARTGVRALVINLLSLGSCLGLEWLDVGWFPALNDYDLETWFVVGINFMLVNSLITLSIGALINGLNISLTRQQAAARAAEAGRAQLAVINMIGNRLSSMLSIDEILDFLYREVVLGFTEAPHFLASFYDPEVDLIRCRYAILDGVAVDVESMPVYPLREDSYFSETIRAAQPLRLDLTREPDRTTAASRTLYLGGERETLSAVFLPLKGPHGELGVVTLQSHKPALYADLDLDFLVTVCSQAAIAIENARLFEMAQGRYAFTESLRAIDIAISGTFDLRLTLDAILRESLLQLDVQAACVLLMTPMHELALSASRGFTMPLAPETQLSLSNSHAGKAVLERRTVTLPSVREKESDDSLVAIMREQGFDMYNAAPLVSKGNVLGVLETFHTSTFPLTREWTHRFETLAGQAAIAVDNVRLFDELSGAKRDLERAYDRTLEGWVFALELRDDETAGHTQRVTSLTMRLAEALNLPGPDLPHIRRGALLHDMGKMGIPDAILRKPGPLTDEEWVVMRTHPDLARGWLGGIEYLRKAMDIPWCHHEKWDGSGYPRGLKGTEIPLAARIFAAADVFDALTSDRPYRKAWSRENALDYVREQSGEHFDPEIVTVFLHLMTEKN